MYGSREQGPGNRDQETGNREQELGFVILSLFCEGSCQSEGKVLMNYIYEVLVPFRRSHLLVGNVARPVPAKPSFRMELAPRVPAKPCIEGVVTLV